MVDFTGFTHYSKEEWLKKIVADFKGNKTPEHFQKEYGQVVLDPFITYDEMSENHRPLDRLFDIMIQGVLIRENDAKLANKTAISLLENGANGLHIFVKESMMPEDLFENIILDFVFVIIEFDKNHGELIKKYIEYINTHYFNKELQVFFIQETEVIFPQKTCILSINEACDWIDKIKNLLQHADRKSVCGQYQKVFISVTMGKDFLMDIAGLRALRIVWENYVSLQGFEEDIALLIFAQPDHQLLADDSNTALIELSYITLAAMLGNADVYFATAKDPQDFEQLRLSNNITNIFYEESHLNKIKDPVAGSLFIEHSTQKIAEAAWQVYQEQRAST